MFTNACIIYYMAEENKRRELAKRVIAGYFSGGRKKNGKTNCFLYC